MQFLFLFQPASQLRMNGNRSFFMIFRCIQKYSCLPQLCDLLWQILDALQCMPDMKNRYLGISLLPTECTQFAEANTFKKSNQDSKGGCIPIIHTAVNQNG